MNLYQGNNAWNQRMEYDNAILALSKELKFEVVEKSICSQSFLRLEQLVTTGLNRITFPILNNQTGNANAVRNTEQRLTLQDAFYVAGISLYIAKATSATAVDFKLHTYPNPVSFAVANEAASLQTIYNGKLQLTVNGRVQIPAYPVSSFNDVPQTQLTAAANSPLTEFHGDGRMSFQPNPVLIGQKGNELELILPSSLPVAEPFTYVVIILNGVLAQNVTVVS